MKRQVISMLMAFIMVISMLFGVTPTVHATEMEETKILDDVSCVNSYCYYDENENLKAGVCLLDGDILLAEGEDYTLSVVEDTENEEYVITATGMGEYSGSLTLSNYSIYSLYETEEWRYIVNEEDYAYVVSYLGEDTNVVIPSYGTNEEYDLYFDGICAGVFAGLDTVTSIDIGTHDIKDSMIINCPNLSQLTIQASADTDVIDIVVGDVSDTFNITAPSDLYLWDDKNEQSLSIEAYCNSKGYKYTDKYAYVSENGFNYKINGTRAEVLSYTGTDATVTVPDSIEYNGEDVYVEYVCGNAFSDLPNLTDILLGDADFGLPLCANCPSLESISSTMSDHWWYTTLTDNPSEAVTIYTYPDSSWWYYDEESEEDIQSTVGEYCEKYGYSYGELEKQYTVSSLDMYVENEYEYMVGDDARVIGGDSATAILFAETEEEGVIQINPQDVVWESQNTNILTVDENGTIKTTKVDQITSVELLATVTIGDSEHQTFASIDVYPRLINSQSLCFVDDTSSTIPAMKYWTYVLYEDEVDGESYAYWTMEQADIPESYEVSYESQDTSVVVVNEDGSVQAADDAKVGSTAKIIVTYTDGNETYTTSVDVEVGESSKVPFELPSADGEAINVYSWNEEASSRIEYFLQMYPQYKKLINFYYIPDMNGAYEKGVLEAFEEEGKEPDIILREVDSIAEGLLQDHIVDLSDIGFNEEWYEDAYPYTKALGSSNGTLKAVTWQSCPGSFIYRTDIAEEVFGTSDPDDVQALVSDWDTFMETAKTLQDAGYDIVSGTDDVLRPMLGNPSTSWVNDNVVNFNNGVENYLEISKELVDKDYTAGTTMWSEEWQANADGKVFGYFGCEWFLNYSFFPEVHKEDYRICEGPGNYAWGGSWLTVTNTGHNNDLIKLLLYTLTCDENAMYRIARGTGDFMNNENVCQRLSDEGRTKTDKLNNQNPYPVWMKMAENISVAEATPYDLDVKNFIATGAKKMNDDDKEIASVAEAMEYIKTEIQKAYPELVFDSSQHQHTFDTNWTIDSEATCKTTGSKSHHCIYEGCTEVKDVTTIPVTNDHKYDDGVVKVAASCGTTGQKVYTCAICKKTKTDVISATGAHKYDNGVITVLPTCTDKGQKTYTCTVCKGTKTEEVAATGTHVYGDWVETKAPQCNEKGEKTRTCRTCGNSETEEIAATGFVKGGEFDKGGNTFTIKTTKGKKGTVVYEAPEKKKKKVTIPKTVKISGKTYTVTEISENAFKNNTKITSVTIPEGVTKIGKNAFSGCKNLKTITIKSTKLKTVGKNAIKGINKKATIKVPKKQYSKYKKLFKSSTGYKKSMTIKKN